MKKVTAIFTLFVVIGIIMGCNKKMTPTAQQQKPSQSLEAEKPMVWRQNLYPKVAVGDPIVFLNSTEIIIDGDFSTQTFFIQDGTIYRMDSVQVITKTVPILTTGVVTKIKKDSGGKISEMDISFSQNDATYTFNFRIKADGSFTLNATAKLLFKEKEYKVQAATKGGECLLLVNFKVNKNVENVNEQAEGQSVSGTKVIK